MIEPSATFLFDQIRRERDLYRRLLALGAQTEIRPLLAEALGLMVEVLGARLGYLELLDDQGGTERRPRWSMAYGLTAEEIDDVRDVVSRGIIAEALATAQTIVTPSALLDSRFQARESVRLRRIEAVLCAPIGQDPTLGVLYLQGRSGARPFSDEDRDIAELFARQLAPLAHRLLVREQSSDSTRPARTALRLDHVIGRSEALAVLLRQVALIAPLDVSVLLTGQSGTGKTQIARVIHENSPRAGQPFIELNCAALPEALFESELFGALPGAHSTATRRILGKVAAADRGTLLLDEVGDLSLPVQAKLLHLLQSKQYYPLGATTPIGADIRLIAATNVDLEAAVADRRFREDLFYRLQVLPLRVPTLAERREDIAELATYFCVQACDNHALPRVTLSREAVRALESAEWPGNVRQLAHAIEAAAIRAAGEGLARIERAQLFPESRFEVEESGEAVTFQGATRRFHARLLGQALEDNGWNVMEVARRLDLARSHVYTLIRAFGLTRR